MKKKLRIFVFAALMLVGSQARAQYIVFDIQALTQLYTLYNTARGQLNRLGQIFGVNTQTLETAQKINSVLGGSGSIADLLNQTGLGDVTDLVHSIHGLESINVNDLFPPDVMGAFLGKTLSQWKDMITNPAATLAQQLRQTSAGAFLDVPGVSMEARLMDFATNSPNKDNDVNGLFVATTFSKMLTTRLLDSLQTQANQQTVYAAKKKSLDDAGQNKNLSILDREKLNNDQKSLDLEIQLNAYQSQHLADTHQAVTLDAQTRLMEQQLSKEELEHAAKN